LSVSDDLDLDLDPEFDGLICALSYVDDYVCDYLLLKAFDYVHGCAQADFCFLFSTTMTATATFAQNEQLSIFYEPFVRYLYT
jgi:hypothetical protein